MLSACAVSTPVQIRSSGDGSSARVGVLIPVVGDDAGSDRAKFAAALMEAFAKNSVSTGSETGLVADYSLSINDASSGIAVNSSEAEPQTAAWIVAPRDKKRFDECGGQRMLGTLILFNRNSGSMVYRGQAAQIECEFKPSDIEKMADQLVEDALKASAI